MTTTPTPLPREDGHIKCSAEYGLSWIVKIEWNTDADGTEIPEGDPPAETYHGPFFTEAEAVEWMNDYPDDTDMYDITSIAINNVRPS